MGSNNNYDKQGFEKSLERFCDRQKALYRLAHLVSTYLRYNELNSSENIGRLFIDNDRLREYDSKKFVDDIRKFAFQISDEFNYLKYKNLILSKLQQVKTENESQNIKYWELKIKESNEGVKHSTFVLKSQINYFTQNNKVKTNYTIYDLTEYINEEFKNAIGLIENLFSIHQNKKKDCNSKTFNHNLTDANFDDILKLANAILLFNKEITLEELKSIFNCTHKTSFTVNNNQNLALLFNYLQPKYIVSNWQSIIEKNKLFKGSRGAFLKAKNLSKSLSNVDYMSKKSKLILNTIEGL